MIALSCPSKTDSDSLFAPDVSLAIFFGIDCRLALVEAAHMKRVIGIGGIFFKSNDPEKLAAWYKEHLGMNVEDWGGVSFQENAGADLVPKRQSHIVWSPFEADTVYFAPSEKAFMINYRVHDLDALLAQLRAEGVDVDPKTERSEFGYFGWVLDPEGNRIELWEPPEK